jgi:hypothetical protein
MFHELYSQDMSGEYTREMFEVGKRAPRITHTYGNLFSS